MTADLSGVRSVLLFPHTLMNRSGMSVVKARDFYKLENEDLLVVCDDLNLPLAKLRFRAKPLLRYSDPTRGMLEITALADATVWRLGEKGRPTAIVTLEIYRSADRASLSYEFASLTPQ